MNRSQRRSTSKKLGIMKFQQKLPFKKKISLIQENIIQGQQMQQEFNEQIRLQINKQEEDKYNDIITHLAQDIANRENISLTQATVKAQNIVKKPIN